MKNVLNRKPRQLGPGPHAFHPPTDSLRRGPWRRRKRHVEMPRRTAKSLCVPSGSTACDSIQRAECRRPIQVRGAGAERPRRSRGESVRPVRAGSGVFHPPPVRAGWRFLFRTSLHFSSGFATACLVSGAWRETANNLQTYSHMRFACKRCDSDDHALSDTARCCVANM